MEGFGGWHSGCVRRLAEKGFGTEYPYQMKQFSIQEPLWFRGGLVFQAHRRVYHSTLGLVVIKKKRREGPRTHNAGRDGAGRDAELCHSDWDPTGGECRDEQRVSVCEADVSMCQHVSSCGIMCHHVSACVIMCQHVSGCAAGGTPCPSALKTGEIPCPSALRKGAIPCVTF